MCVVCESHNFLIVCVFLSLTYVLSSPIASQFHRLMNPRAGPPVCSVLRFMDKFLEYLNDVQKHYRRYENYFLVIEEFALLGVEERR